MITRQSPAHSGDSAGSGILNGSSSVMAASTSGALGSPSEAANAARSADLAVVAELSMTGGARRSGGGDAASRNSIHTYGVGKASKATHLRFSTYRPSAAAKRKKKNKPRRAFSGAENRTTYYLPTYCIGRHRGQQTP